MSREDFEKYRPKTVIKPVDYFVEKANREIRIESVLADYFNVFVPLGARSWKTDCPFRREHADGGADKQFRVYSETNTCHCFESHGTMDPVRLWAVHLGSGQKMRQVAIDLLESYGINTKTKTYRERFEEARKVPEENTPDPQSLVSAFQLFLSSVPQYEARQYDEDVLQMVAEVTNVDIPYMCSGEHTVQDIFDWFSSAKVVARACILS